MQLLTKFKKIYVHEVQSHLKFSEKLEYFASTDDIHIKHYDYQLSKARGFNVKMLLLSRATGSISLSALTS